MKIVAKKYAQALYQSIEGKTEVQTRAALENFVEILSANNGLFLADKICIEFVKIFDKASGLLEVEVITANGFNQESLKLIKGYLKKTTRARELDVRNTIDKKIIGGIVIKYQDKIIDASLNSSVESLRQSMAK